MDEPRILIGVVTYEGKDYIFDQCMSHIKAISYPKNKVDVVVVDNTAKPTYLFKLMRRGYKGLYRVERGDNSREALTKSQNKIRELFLEGGYDYLLLIESDLLVPPDTIRRLLSYDKQVVGSAYIIGTGNVRVPCIFIDDIMKGGFRGTRPLGIKIDEFGRKVSSPKEIDEFFAQEGDLIQVHGTGFGCTLIRRDVVEQQPFWCDTRFEDKHSDVYFFLDMARARIPVFVDKSVIVPHFPTDWAKVADR